jgi:hypothetical protein
VRRALRDAEGQPEDEGEARADCVPVTVPLVVALKGLAVTGEGEGRGERLPVHEGVKETDSEGQGDAEGEEHALREGAALPLGASAVGDDGGDGECAAVAVLPQRGEALPVKDALPEGEREGAPLLDAEGHAVALSGVPEAATVELCVRAALREGAGEREGDCEVEGLEKSPPELPLGGTLLLGAPLLEALALRVRLALTEGEWLPRGEALPEGPPPLGVPPVPLAEGERDGKGEREGVALPVPAGAEAEAHAVNVFGSELEMVDTGEGDG